tara:strand:+ start:189 stop:1436 length:1248 start_codon:yes stop_codon:yes gene_type:complete
MADSLRQSIGAALGGFGAGVAGQGAQFLQQQSNKKLLDEKQVRQARAKDLIQARGFLQRGDTAGAADVFQNRVDVLDQNGMDSSNSKNALSAILTAQSTDDLNNVMGHFNDDLLDLVNDETISGEGLGLGTARGGLASAKTEILSDGTVVQALPSGEVQVRDPSGNIVTGQARLDALNSSRQASLSKTQAESDIKVQAEGDKVEAVALAKAKNAPLIAKTSSFINSQVKLADKAATERGSVLTDLNRMQAALPGLTDVVGKLRELAPVATSTFGGRVYDRAAKELGFGATKGATASTKFGAMVNNQILPLLKPTFGGSFSIQEGQELKATMGDKSLSVDEKLATLDAFIEQKQRDIETKQLQLDNTETAQAPTASAQGQAQPQGQATQEVTTQAQFNSLPSGALYTEDGVQYRKP